MTVGFGCNHTSFDRENVIETFRKIIQNKKPETHRDSGLFQNGMKDIYFFSLILTSTLPPRVASLAAKSGNRSPEAELFVL